MAIFEVLLKSAIVCSAHLSPNPMVTGHMALFAVNTGCRDSEICNLRWEWEQEVPELGTSVFIPGSEVKNGDDRLVVLNEVASSVLKALR